MGSRDFTNHLVHLTHVLEQLQAMDGSWRFCFESGPMTDAYLIIILRSLGIQEEQWIERLASRILNLQDSNGGWKLYEDEEPSNLPATVEAYYGLLFSRLYSKEDNRLQLAKQIICSMGGMSQVNRPTKVILELTGQLPWKTSFFPMGLSLLPPSFPINFYDLVGFSRVHIAPVLIAANRRFSLRTAQTPDLSELLLCSPTTGLKPKLFLKRRPISILNKLNSLSEQQLERFLLERIEENGTLLSYASSTYLMIFALLALGYPKNHPIILRAISGIKSLAYETSRGLHIQNSPSTVWDTALISYSLQEAGLTADERAIRRAGRYLLSRQHTKKGDWSVHNPDTAPGGWGFSDINTLNPDIDDTTACLRAISQLAKVSGEYHSAWTRGMNWLLSMQNQDGGWPAFEKNTNKKLLSHLSIDGAHSSLIDPSSADLTGRVLEFLGNFAGFTINNQQVKQAVRWLMENQNKDGSWYGRWGVCFLYGTWAAVTGLLAVGVPKEHSTIQRAIHWISQQQNPDGGWGESCKSDIALSYVRLGASTPTQTAWALDALIAAHPTPTPSIELGLRYLADSLYKKDWTTNYPTGGGLPGGFYIHYHSYRYIWPTLALSHYQKKYGPGTLPDLVH